MAMTMTMIAVWCAITGAGDSGRTAAPAIAICWQMKQPAGSAGDGPCRVSRSLDWVRATAIDLAADAAATLPPSAETVCDHTGPAPTWTWLWSTMHWNAIARAATQAIRIARIPGAANPRAKASAADRRGRLTTRERIFALRITSVRSEGQRRSWAQCNNVSLPNAKRDAHLGAHTRVRRPSAHSKQAGLDNSEPAWAGDARSRGVDPWRVFRLPADAAGPGWREGGACGRRSTQ